MEKAKQRKDEECARLVAEQRASGKTQKAWCEKHGIKLRTFRGWAHKLNTGAWQWGSSSDVTWVSVENEALSDTSANRHKPVEVKIGPYTVTVNTGFERAVFLEVCGALAEIC